MQTTFHDKIMNTIHLMGGGEDCDTRGEDDEVTLYWRGWKKVLKK